ncbi:MAG: hypothetical protein K2K80_04045 [Clostridia bacterium]|nr:hypothetical protein [Clostridia bacterium]
MKSLTKRIGAFAAAGAMSLSIIVGTGLITDKVVFAEESKDYSGNYYYNRLSDDKLAQNFYKAFDALVSSGEFKKGTVEYDLIAEGVATREQIASYVSGDSQLVLSYGAGRDAFYMDHPDLFYADVFSTSISAGTTEDGEYVGYLDSSRALNTYVGNLNSAAKIDTAITAYENAVNAIVTEANKKVSVAEKIEYVNDYIKTHNTYGYGTQVVGDKNVDTEKAAFIQTSYGALVNYESVCEGYAKSFKAVLDRLEIPCVLVAGYVYNDGYQPHMWNYVQIDDMWYGVDVTNNDWSDNKYLLCGGDDMVGDYVVENIVSASEYVLPCPAIKPYAYGIDTDANGMVIVGKYTDNEEGGKDLSLTVSYNGKGALKLEEEGLYLVYRQTYDVEQGQDKWSQWFNIVAANKDYVETTDDDYYTITDTETIVPVDSAAKYVQFAILNRTSDMAFGAYSDVKDSDFIVAPSTQYINDGYIHVDREPFPIKVTPGNTATLSLNKVHITINYDRKLALADQSKPAGITVTTFENYPDIDKYFKLENFSWDGDKTISFDFTPSLQYEHYKATYFFTPDNLIDAENNLMPISTKYVFAGENIMCNKMLPGGRYCVKSFGSPKLVDDCDLSVTDFKDENGKYYSESQRSQLMLVATKPAASREKEMTDALKNETGVTDNDIVASSTFEIELALCRNVKQIPQGSFLQVSFGFPEGYKPDDEGTTYKIYHYKRENGKIVGVEEIPVIVTSYGLIAQVQSFSPFTIVQVKNTSAAVTNSNTVNVYASVNGGAGGKVTTDGKSGIVEVTGDTITYDLTAEEGFTVGTVLLNGKVVDASEYADGKLTLNKSDLDASNTLEVSFVTKVSAEKYAEKGFTPVYGATNHVILAANADDVGPNVTAIVIGVVGAVVVLAGAGVAAWLIIRKRKSKA